jgi:RecA-family ATPase
MTTTLFPDPLFLPDLHKAAAPTINWLWHGYLAPGNVTLLTSQWKAGKTTLVSILLHHMKAGGQVAGLPVAPARVLVLSEESPAHWLQRSQQFDYTSHVAWFCRPFAGKPTASQWQQFLDHILTLHQHLEFQLLVIDPLATFLPGRDENNASLMMECLAPLQKLTRVGLAVLLLHHPRKNPSTDGRSARGSGALTGFADILIEMHWIASPSDPDRRRSLLSWSRHTATPRQLVLELDPDAANYTCLGDLPTFAATTGQTTIHDILAAASHKLTRQEILDLWPATQRAPDIATIGRWLDKSTQFRSIYCSGTGHKGDPLRYWLPESEAEWKKDTFKRLQLEQDEVMRRLMEDLNRQAESD